MKKRWFEVHYLDGTDTKYFKYCNTMVCQRVRETKKEIEQQPAVNKYIKKGECVRVPHTRNHYRNIHIRACWNRQADERRTLAVARPR
jgi:hypothetical protein